MNKREVRSSVTVGLFHRINNHLSIVNDDDELGVFFVNLLFRKVAQKVK